MSLENEKRTETYQDFYDRLTSIDLKIHNRYTPKNLEDVQGEIERYLEEGIRKYQEIHLDGAKDGLDGTEYTGPNKDGYQKLHDQLAKLKAISDNFDFRKVSKKNRAAAGSLFSNMLDDYSELTYSFQTAEREISHVRSAPDKKDSGGMILLCKNVRIIEDLISKICSNNIDKSIIGGEKHFDSMRYGFEWLFCHNDINSDAETRRIDIRDQNRFLDYIKYQIRTCSQYVEASPKTTVEIDRVSDQIRLAFEKKPFDKKRKTILAFKENFIQLIKEFFDIYEILIKYRDALFREEEIRKSLNLSTDSEGSKDVRIKPEIIDLSSVAVRVLLDRFVSFVKISDQNFGNSTFDRSWFNYSELSKSNYAGSSFESARIENAKMKDCDISTSNLSLADGGATDFSNSNFNYSNLTGTNLIGAVLNNCELQNAFFRDSNVDSYQDAIEKSYKAQLSDEAAASDEDGADEDSTDEDSSEENNAIGTLIKLWTPELIPPRLNEDPWDKILKEYEKLSLPDLNTHELNASVPSILKRFRSSEIDISNISGNSKKILKRHLSEHIPAKLLNWAKDRFEWDDASEYEQKYGKVLFETAELASITAKSAQLANCDLCHIDISEASFEDSDLSAAHMYYTKAPYAALVRTNINRCDCFEANFFSANFSNAIANKAIFLNCDLNHTNWNKSILIGCTFADLSKLLEEVRADAEKEPKALDLFIGRLSAPPDQPAKKTDSPDKDYWQKDCSINDASFNDALADRSVFLNISVERSSFLGASLKTAILANCRMVLADFINADLRYSKIIVCRLSQSNFHACNLTDTVLKYVDFSDSNLSGALFNLAKMNHILFENANLNQSNFSGATIHSCVFSNCSVSGMILTGTKFENCVFDNFDLTKLIAYQSATFKKCKFNNCGISSDGSSVTKYVEEGKIVYDDEEKGLRIVSVTLS